MLSPQLGLYIKWSIFAYSCWLLRPNTLSQQINIYIERERCGCIELYWCGLSWLSSFVAYTTDRVQCQCHSQYCNGYARVFVCIFLLVCSCGWLLEKGLQVSNLIEIIPLKWTLVQHSCFVNPISCMQSIYTMQNRHGQPTERKRSFNMDTERESTFSCFTMCFFIAKFMCTTSAFKCSKLRLGSDISIGVILNRPFVFTTTLFNGDPAIFSATQLLFLFCYCSFCSSSSFVFRLLML